MSLLGIPAARIRDIGEAWSDGGLWDDIAWLAALAWVAENEAQRRMRWHHLVMTVGNFKRQSGRRLRPSPVLPVTRRSFAARAEEFRGPDGLRIGAEDRSSWQDLENGLKGAGTATTTTILAALWPDRHHILDWRVLAAVTGLDIATGNNALALVRPDSREKLQPDLDRYSRIRPLLIQQASEARLPLSTVERALYLITASVRGAGLTWAQYGQQLLNTAPKPPGGNSGDSDGALDNEQDIPPPAP